MLEEDVKELRLRWTVDTRSRPGPRQPFISPAFRFRGDRGWSLSYFEKSHCLCLCPPTAGPSAPIDVAVHLESGATVRIVPGLSEKTQCTENNKLSSTNGKVYLWCIWSVSESEVKRLDPDFRRGRHLRFLVVLSDGDASVTPTDVKSTQTEYIGHSRHPVTSTSVQTECLLPEAALHSAGPTASASIQTTLLQNTPDCLESLSHDFSKLLDQGSDPDVEFQCSGQSTAAHGTIISVRSEVFASMLASDMLEGRTRVIKIPDIGPDVFRHFLRYIYTGTLPDLTLDLALNLYEAGDRYSVMGLARRCAKFLLEHLAVDNACGVLLVADAHSDKDLKEAVLRFMVDNKVPQVSSCWLEFCGAHPMLAVEVLNRFFNIVTQSTEICP